jgi:hypothetical protein
VTELVDYSYSHPPVQDIVNAGYLGAMRYLGSDSRCIYTPERDELLNAGLGIGLIWETSTDRVLGGAGAGRSDAELANNYANALGAPSVPIYYCTDFHAQGGQITGPICDYYRAARDYGGREVRVYGGAPVIDHMHDVLGLVAGWQPAAKSWSDYRDSPYAVMFQQVEYVLNNSSDRNIVACGDDDIDWLWGYEGGFPVTPDELRQIVAEETSKAINTTLAKMYTGSRLVIIDGDPAVYEVCFQNGERVRRHIKSQNEVNMLQYVDSIAGAPGVDAPRKITDPGQVEAFKALRVVNPDEACDPDSGDDEVLYGEPIERIQYDD